MQGLILAAGMGSRLKRITKHQAKCMVEVNGTSLIKRMLTQLINAGIQRVIVVVGYKADVLQEYIEQLHLGIELVYVHNDIYDKTNNIYSFYLAKDEIVKDDTVLLESDLIFDDTVIQGLLSDKRPNLAVVDKYESWMDGTCLELDTNDHITKFVPGSEFDFKRVDSYYKTVNIYKFSKDFLKRSYLPFIEAYMSAMGTNQYYERALKSLVELDSSLLCAKRLNGEKWYEIDDAQDLDIASSIFCKPSEKLAKMMKRYGGYWRYPHVLDFCYLVNPYFPPTKLVEELQANFKVLLTQYPSGLEVNSLLAGKNFNIKQENITVGNGASELIKALMDSTSKEVGFIRPTFEEYPNRYHQQQSICFYPSNKDYSYTCDDVISFFSDKTIKTLVLVNPDNPTGNYIPKHEMLKLVQWTKERGIVFILDESFVDFADEEDSSFIKQDIIDDNPQLFVVKSISKSYGIPGLRLGIVASGNVEAIQKIKKTVAIWNINSFGEYYLQIAEKYKKDYMCALVKIRAERSRFEQELAQIRGLRVIPSQANYVMVQITGDITTAALTEIMLSKYNILIKDLSSKVDGKKYLRLAVRDEKDDNVLLQALRNEMF